MTFRTERDGIQIIRPLICVKENYMTLINSQTKAAYEWYRIQTRQAETGVSKVGRNEHSMAIS